MTTCTSVLSPATLSTPPRPTPDCAGRLPGPRRSQSPSWILLPLPEELAHQGTVVDLTAALAVISRLVCTEPDTPLEDVPEPEPIPITGPPALRAATAELEAKLHTDVSWLQRIIDLLAARQQVVLYGPPGTGKTYVARALAAHDAIRLQYSPQDSFTLPPNVFFIGTMNTADRLIALVDTAMRRRFAFAEMHPEEPPVRELLTRWLAANGKEGDERARLLAALNAEIGAEDWDYKIGPVIPDDARCGSGGRARPVRPRGDPRQARHRALMIPLAEDDGDGVVVSLDAARAAALADSGLVHVRPFGAERWWLLPRGRVGAVRLDGVDVVVTPKVGIARLLFLLGYAANPGFRPEDVEGVLDEDLWPATRRDAVPARRACPRARGPAGLRHRGGGASAGPGRSTCSCQRTAQRNCPRPVASSAADRSSIAAFSPRRTRS